MAVLVDSSLWVHQLRKSGDPAKRDRVNALLERGFTVPVADLLIFACATLNGLSVAHDDAHFEALAGLGEPAP